MAYAVEVKELIESLRDRDKIQQRFIENRMLAYDILRKWAAVQARSGAKQLTITWKQLAVEYYDDITPETPLQDVIRRKRTPLRELLRDLAAVGLIAWGPLCSAEGRVGANGTRQRGGKHLCLWFELRDVDAALDSLRSGSPAGIAQSVRAAES